MECNVVLRVCEGVDWRYGLVKMFMEIDWDNFFFVVYWFEDLCVKVLMIKLIGFLVYV